MLCFNSIATNRRNGTSNLQHERACISIADIFTRPYSRLLCWLIRLINIAFILICNSYEKCNVYADSCLLMNKNDRNRKISTTIIFITITVINSLLSLPHMNMNDSQKRDHYSNTQKTMENLAINTRTKIFK